MTVVGARAAELRGKAAIVGVYESPRRKAPQIHPYGLQAEVVRGALEDAGLEPADVDGFCTVASMQPEGGQEMAVVEIAEYLGVRPRWVDATDTGGSAFLSHATNAALAIDAGFCDVVVISYAARGRSWPVPYQDTVSSPYGPGQWELPYGPNTVANYALAANRHMHEHGTKPEDLAKIAVQARANAAANPSALRREPITVEDVLASRPIASPLTSLDCCVVTDSGGALVLTSPARAKSLRRAPVQILGAGHCVDRLHMNQSKDLLRTAAAVSGPAALASAGMTLADIDSAQLYDSFTITVLLTLESLGFCPRGQGGDFVASGALAPDGRLPFNTDGGGLSSNHPGRRGALALIEAVRLLRGESPGVNIPDAETCLVHATGGFLSTASTMILGI